MIDLAKLTKILMLTQSPEDGEALAAIRKANAMLKKEGMNWEECLSKYSRSKKKPSSRHEERHDERHDHQGERNYSYTGETSSEKREREKREEERAERWREENRSSRYYREEERRKREEERRKREEERRKREDSDDFSGEGMA